MMFSVACTNLQGRVARVVLAAKRGTSLPVLLLFSLVIWGCAGKQEPAGLSPFALDGPQLTVTGEYQGVALEGTMDRHVMVGIGRMELRSKDREAGMFCEGRVNTPPTEKARIRAVLDCTEGRTLFLTLRNLGPDQGIGVGHLDEGKDLLMLFYHTSKEEAERRFPAVRASLLKAKEKAEE